MIAMSVSPSRPQWRSPLRGLPQLLQVSALQSRAISIFRPRAQAVGNPQPPLQVLGYCQCLRLSPLEVGLHLENCEIHQLPPAAPHSRRQHALGPPYILAIFSCQTRIEIVHGQLDCLTSIFFAAASSSYRYFLAFPRSRSTNIFLLTDLFSHFLAKSLRMLSTVLKKTISKNNTVAMVRAHTLQT